MELTIYRQRYTEKNGVKNPHGQDAIPYIGNGLLFVADGRSAGAVIRHRLFDERLMSDCKEELCSALFSDNYREVPAELQDYAYESFRDLRELKSVYFTDRAFLKKGGYYGSRLSAISILKLFYTTDYFERLFSDAQYYMTSEKTAFLSEKGKELGHIIRDEMRLMAQRVNLIYESRMTNLTMLATTLSAILFKEHDSYVDAICMNAGDSRCFSWNKTNGLQQLSIDDGESDMGMTNYIHTEDGAEFHINLGMFRFEKPIILMTATDGAYGSHFFKEKNGFESFLLYGFASSSTPEEVKGLLNNMYETYGKHDDSSSIAMKIFGYDDYDDLKRDMLDRGLIING